MQRRRSQKSKNFAAQIMGEGNEDERRQAEAIKAELQEKLELLKKLDDEILELVYEKEENDVIDKELQEAADCKQRVLCSLFSLEDF